jgi:hypothetical protein
VSIGSQFGTFFLVVGLLILLIFFGTVQANDPAYSYCLSGGALAAVGFWLVWRERKPPPPPARFNRLRKWQEQRKNKGKEKRDKGR